MLRVIRRARRRLLANELFAQAVNACGLALLALIVLLATVASLRWGWLLGLGLTLAAAGVFLALKRRPSPYSAAQIVDRRLGLADTLSTAWFFNRTETPRAPDAMLDGQLAQAERISTTLDVRRAVPFRLPRRAYAVAAMALVAAGLFALRYGMAQNADAHPPLARLLEQQFGLEPKNAPPKNSRRQPPPNGAEDSGEDMAGDEQSRGANSDASEDQDADAGDQDSAQPDAAKRNAAAQNANDDPQSASGDQDQASDQGDETSDPRESGSADQQQRGRQSDQAKSSNSQRDANGSESNSLFSKMKDALQNLLSRVKPQQNSAGTQPPMDQSGKQQSKDKQNGGKQQSSKNGQRGENGQPGDADEDQQGDSADSQGNPSKSDSPQAGKQAGNGIGTQDGDKTIQEAQQLAAMGKISEIIGKRSATLTGEATVEVESTAQKLHTPYADRTARHAQGGAEINRDEIPVSLQTYVESYFEQVQQQAKK